MSRWMLFTICTVAGLTLLACGLFVPAHIRAVDVSVVQKAGQNTPSLASQAAARIAQANLGAAQLLAQAAEQAMLPDRDQLTTQISSFATAHPELRVWGGPDTRFATLFAATNSAAEPVTEFIIRLGNRERTLELLQTSKHPLVREILRTRALTNTQVFPPASSSSGQAFDAALSICGLLADGSHLKAQMAKSIFLSAAQANRGADSQPFEQILLDLMSLGQRFNWGQMAAFVSQVDDPETLRILANQVRKSQGQLPVLFAAVDLTGNASGVSKFLRNYSQTGLNDLADCLRYGAGGVNELLARNQRLNTSPPIGARVIPLAGIQAITSTWCWRTPSMALTFKWLLYLWAGFLVAMAMHFARPTVSALERPLQVRGFHIFREVLFALGFLLVVLLLSEPFLSQESQKVDFPFRLHLPIVGSGVPAGTAAHPSIMNPLSLLTLLLFFVLQALLFTACIVKLAEIRRQKAPARLKLKLLENEDHLFDAGLYLGFAGTIVSLILVSLGVIKQPSLMAAYSSTSFGIIFVSIFKIFNLRPVRRKLILEVESENSEPVTPAIAKP